MPEYHFTQPITEDLLKKMRNTYESEPHLNVLARALSETSLFTAAYSPLDAAKLQMDFSIDLTTTGITAQYISGRCWMFATMNDLRERVIRKYNLEEFALSGNYLAFYDKLEKCNKFLDYAITYADDPLDSRENEVLFRKPLGDGGEWESSIWLMRKYGIVPKWIMPDTANASDTSSHLPIINNKLREDALVLRKMIQNKEDITAAKEAMLQEFYNALCILYGEPVDHFDFAYTDKDKQYHCMYNMTPLSFFHEAIGDNFDDYCIIMSTSTHPYYKAYTTPHNSSSTDYANIWINLPYKEMEELMIRQLKEGEYVLFSCDSTSYRDRNRGYWDIDSFRYGDVLGGMTLGMSKEERIATYASTADHCMLFCGVNFDENGQPDRWKIENSWGDTVGHKGYFVSSEKWNENFVYEVTIRKDLLSKEQLALYDEEPIPTKLWDNM